MFSDDEWFFFPIVFFDSDVKRVVSHIQDFGDAPTSLYGDAASLAEDAVPTLGRSGHPALKMYRLL